MLAISAKLGQGVSALLDRVVQVVPPPPTLGRWIQLSRHWIHYWSAMTLL